MAINPVTATPAAERVHVQPVPGEVLHADRIARGHPGEEQRQVGGFEQPFRFQGGDLLLQPLGPARAEARQADPFAASLAGGDVVPHEAEVRRAVVQVLAREAPVGDYQVAGVRRRRAAVRMI